MKEEGQYYKEEAALAAPPTPKTIPLIGIAPVILATTLGNNRKKQEPPTAFMLCRPAVMLGAPVAMISVQKEMTIDDLLVASAGLLLLCRPDTSRHI